MCSPYSECWSHLALIRRQVAHLNRIPVKSPIDTKLKGEVNLGAA